MMALLWRIVSRVLCNRANASVPTRVTFWPYHSSIGRVCASGFHGAHSIVYALGSIVALPLRTVDRQILDGRRVSLAGGITISP